MALEEGSEKVVRRGNALSRCGAAPRRVDEHLPPQIFERRRGSEGN